MVSPYRTAQMLREKHMTPQTVFVKIVPNHSPNIDGKWEELPYRPSAPAHPQTRRQFAEEYLCDIPEGHHIVAMTFSKPENFPDG